MPFVNLAYACQYDPGSERPTAASAHPTGRPTFLSGHSQGRGGECLHQPHFTELRDQSLPGNSSSYWGV